MTAGLMAMLLGVFVVPAALLWMGHRFRRRSARWRAAFWGGVIGHLAALVIGSLAAMIPPEEWAPTDMWRGLLGFWSFVLFPLLGAAAAMVASRRAGASTAN